MSFFTDIINIVSTYYPLLLSGLGYTMLIALIGTVAGLAIGLLIGIFKTLPPSKHGFPRALQKIFTVILNIYIEVFRGTPMMVQAMVIYWGYAFAAGGNTLPLLPAGIFIVSINTGAYMAEIVRGGIISVDKGQIEGAHSIGLTHFQTMFYVVLPQAIRNVLPSIANEFVINIKDTSVLNVIGVMELFYQAQVVKALNLKVFQTYLIISVIYFIVTFVITRLLRLLEKLLTGSDTYTIYGSQSDPDAEIKVKAEVQNV